MGEVDAKALLCNRCWGPLLSAAKRFYKTSCDHLYCRKCAEKDFSRKLQCSLCDTDLSDEGGVAELDCSKQGSLPTAAFALALIQPDEALRVVYEAFRLARQQTALYGTREIWVRGMENEGVKRKLVEAENSLNSVGMELASKTREVAELQKSLQARNDALADTERKYTNLKRLHERGSGGGGGGATGGMGGGGGNMMMMGPGSGTMQMGAHPTPNRRPSLTGSDGGGMGPQGFPMQQHRPASGGAVLGGGGGNGMGHMGGHGMHPGLMTPSSSSGHGHSHGTGSGSGGQSGSTVHSSATSSRVFGPSGQPYNIQLPPSTPMGTKSVLGSVGGGGGSTGSGGSSGGGLLNRGAYGNNLGSGMHGLKGNGRARSPGPMPGMIMMQAQQQHQHSQQGYPGSGGGGSAGAVGLATIRAPPPRVQTAVAMEGAQRGTYHGLDGRQLNMYVADTPLAAGRATGFSSVQGLGGFGSGGGGGGGGGH